MHLISFGVRYMYYCYYFVSSTALSAKYNEGKELNSLCVLILKVYIKALKYIRQGNNFPG